ncbi:MAG: hypothetical protein KatS3mg111_3068 [Pirellulaceae bacterium]|nr:MAG: hypothetical protein KatS3mg111_3068 [Pirellulaceae bacterium]
MLLFYSLFPVVSAGDRNIGVVSSLFLWPSNNPPALSVAWTLIHEMVFYTIFSFFFLSRRLLNFLLILWGVTIVTLHLADVDFPRAVNYVMSPLNLDFILGICIFHVREMLARSKADYVTTGALIIGVAIVWWNASTWVPSRVLASIGFGLLLFAVTLPPIQKITAPRVLTILGSASYSIYLVHNPALSALARIWTRIGEPLSPGIGYAFLSLLAITMGLLYWWTYEQPAVAWVKSMATGRSGMKERKRLLELPNS